MGKIIEIIFLIVLGLLFIFNIIFLMYIKALSQKDYKQSGFEVARILSDKLLNENVHIIKKKGKLLDYYNEKRNTIKLSNEVFDGKNLYACASATSVVLNANNKIKKINNLVDFLVMASLSVIIIGAFLINYSFIHFGMIIFIAAVLLVFSTKMFPNEEEQKNILHELHELKIIDEDKDEEDAILCYQLINVVNIPYRWINIFR